MKRTKIFKIIFILFSLLFLQAEFFGLEKSKIFSDKIVDLSIESGAGIYCGPFGQHLFNDGAYLVTPLLDFTVSFYILKYFGLLCEINSGCIIHPYSEPIEGTILYTILDLFFHYDFKHLFLRIFVGAGIQHTTMLIQWYASGVFSTGITLGIRLQEWLYLISSVKYRMGFLHSIIIDEIYGLEKSDRLMSINLTLGLSFRIKNPYLKS
ncbi:MAG: hypothetical protein MJB14_08570 [Spirochaetes bacterium]|nr:hypothetical protein [Spirochaetota bacterium]